MPCRSRFVVLLALAAILAAGCSPPKAVLARVGSRAITEEDFLIVARQIGAGYPGPPDTMKTRLLEDLIRRELLVQAAIARGVHRDTTLIDQRARLEEQALRERLFADLGGDFPVSEEEIQTFYRWRTQETRARVVFSHTRERIQAAHEALRGGIDFASVADRFNPAGFTAPGGDVGFTAPGLLLQPLDDLIRTSPVGQVIGPVEAPNQGWFLLKVEERRQRQSPPLESERAVITEVIRQRKQREVMVRAIDRLTAAYDVQVVKGAAQELTLRAQESSRTGVVPELTPGEQALPMARYRGGVYTMGDAYQDLMSGRSNPDFQVLATVERWLQGRALDRVVLAEARARHYLEEPDVERALRERTNDFLLQSWFSQEVLLPVQATEEDARALHARSEPQLTLQSARVLMVNLSDSAAASQLALTARQVEGLREAVATAAPGSRVRSETLSFPNPNPFLQALEPELRMRSAGDYAGPFPMPRGWLVVQLLDKTQSAADFDRLPLAERERLLNEATEIKRQEHVNTLVAELRRSTPVTIDWRRLKKLRWPEMVEPPPPGEG